VEESLKQRLVGALVLLLLAIIFLPLILDGRDDKQPEAVYRVPPEPVIHITHKGNDEVEKRLKVARSQFIEDRKVKPSVDVAADKAVKLTQVPSKQKNLSSQQQGSIEATKKLFVEELAAVKTVRKKPIKSKVALANAWILQVAAFSKQSNASALQSKLLKKSYMAYIKQTGSAEKPLYRVFVGPELRKNRALIIQKAIKKEFKLAALIKSYNP